MAPIVISIVICALCYFLYKDWQHRRKLSWIPAIPGYPIVGNILDFKKSSEYLHVLYRYAQRNDGLVQIALATNRMILSSNYEFLEFVLSSTKILDKSRDYGYLNKWLGTGLLTAPGEKWRTSRKIITPAFHFSILEQFVDIFDEKAQILVDILMTKCDNSVTNVYPFVANCALDIIGESAMGVPINAQANVCSDYVNAIKEVCRIVMHRVFSVVKMFDLSYFFTRDYWDELRYLKVLHGHTDSVIKARKAALENKLTTRNSDEPDEFGSKKKLAFLDSLLQATENGKPLSDLRIREEVDTFMFEGHDTTTSGISFALYCLASHPDVQTRALEEQRSIFGKDFKRPTTFKDLQEMKYLEMVIKETLRMYPSVPLYTRLTNQELIFKDGKVIPAGVPIILFAFGIHRNPKYFPDPDKFLPSRFENMQGKPYAYIPFSAGSRNCIGQKFAMLEMKSILSKCLRNFELNTAGKEFEPVLATEIVLISLNGIHLKLAKRSCSI